MEIAAFGISPVLKVGLRQRFVEHFSNGNFVSPPTAEYYYFITTGSCLLDYVSTLRGHVQNLEGILHPSTAQKFHTLLGSCLQTNNGHGLEEWDHLW